MKKSTLILSLLASVSLVGCGSEKQEEVIPPTPDDENEKDPTLPETLSLKKGVELLNERILAIPETFTEYGINNNLKVESRTDDVDPDTKNVDITIQSNHSHGSVSIGENMLRYVNKQIDGNINRTVDKDENTLEEVIEKVNYDEELHEKLDTNGYAHYKCVGTINTKVKSSDPTKENSLVEINDLYKIEGTNAELSEYIKFDVTSTLETATISCLESFDFLKGDLGSIEASVELVKNKVDDLETFTFNILDEEKPSTDTKVYKDSYKVIVVLKNGLLKNFNYYSDYQYELENGYREHYKVTNENTIDNYTKITYPDTSKAKEATDYLDVTPWGEIILGFAASEE